MKERRKKLVDWEWKRKVVSHIAGDIGPLGEFVERMICESPRFEREKDLVGKIATRAYHWDKSDPTDPDSLFFWDQLREFLGIPNTVYVQQLLNATVDGLIDMIPNGSIKEDAQRWLEFSRRSSLLHPTRPTFPPAANPAIYPISTHDTGLVETIRTGLNVGRIDQKHYYLDPDSAEDWNTLISDKDYPTYDHCRLGLIDLVDCDPWNSSIAISKPSTVVMLAGGGAPSKDRVFVRYFLNRRHIQYLHYYLVDISFYMLMSSVRTLQAYLKVDGSESRVTLTALNRDILKLPAEDYGLFHQRGAVLFAITAGTIGNLNEAEFFRSLNTVSGPGDILVISADTIDGLSKEKLAHTKDKYDNPALRHWLKPVVGTVISELRINKPLEDVLMGPDILVDFQPAGPYSDIPGSYSVVVTLNHGKKPTLLTSTRYESCQLLHYAEERGWESICTTSIAMNPSFKQFAFRRKALKTLERADRNP